MCWRRNVPRREVGSGGARGTQTAGQDCWGQDADPAPEGPGVNHTQADLQSWSLVTGAKGQPHFSSYISSIINIYPHYF